MVLLVKQICFLSVVKLISSGVGLQLEETFTEVSTEIRQLGSFPWGYQSSNSPSAVHDSELVKSSGA